MTEIEAADAAAAPAGPDTKIERRGPIAILTLSNPGRRGAFSPESRLKLAIYLQELATDKSCRVIILTGEDGHFCVGADLVRVGKKRAEAQTQTDNPRSAIDIREHTKSVLNLLRALSGGPKPVIAAVEGDTFGGGLAFAAACDVLVCARDARFGTSFTAIGLLPDLGLLYTLPQRMGAQRARTMLMLSSRMDGEEAYRSGLADEVVDPGCAMDAALVWAEKFLLVAPIAVALTKEALGSGINCIEDVIRIEADLVPLMSTTRDNKEGVTAFLEKRKPMFKGY
jgi:enoyl-CoA hydratase/carnithine racemase